MQISKGSIRPFLLPGLLGLLAVVLYLPGITWGLPPTDTADKLVPWGPDELAPMSPIRKAYQLWSTGQISLLKYPLFHYLVLAVSYAPYLGWQLLTGGLGTPQPSYPFGFTDPIRSIQALVVIARAVSVFMAAATVVITYFLAKTLWDRTTGLLAGLFVMLMYPMFYYGRMSNVDVPAQFWSTLVFLLGARVLREGWTAKKALWMGTFAALAVATKDQSYAILLLLPLALIPFHYRAVQQSGEKRVRNYAQAPLAGLLVAIVIYALTSGLALSPAAFARHVVFVRTAWYADFPSLWYFRYSDNLQGYLGLMRESGQQIVDSLGWPLFLAACAGVFLCAARDRSKLIFLVPIPLLYVGVILPVRHTAIRFVMPLALILCCYAAFALATALRSRHALLRAAGLLVIVGGCGLAVLRAADLTYLLFRDSRYEAAAWLERNLRARDSLQYFESPSGIYTLRLRTFPHIPERARLVDAAVHLGREPVLDGEFVMTMGPEDHLDHWFCPAWVHRSLLNGSLGYELVRTFETRSLFSHPHLTHVNPRVHIFARHDRAALLRQDSSADAPASVR